jgi:hypothetical protein
MLYKPGAIMVYNSSSCRVQKAVFRARRRSYLPEKTLSLHTRYNEGGREFYNIPYHQTCPTSVAFTKVS